MMVSACARIARHEFDHRPVSGGENGRHKFGINLESGGKSLDMVLLQTR
jgi:hypothetical protein